MVSDGVVGGFTWTKLYIATEKPRVASSRKDRHNNIEHLHPTVRTAVVKTFVQLRAQGIPFRIFEAFRYSERQADLYAQGRTKPGNIVTYAKPWSSYHQYGLAVDFVLYINDSWSWDTSGSKAGWWKKLHEIGQAEGLMRLDFETPHLQLAGTSSSALRQGVYPPNGDRSWFDNFMSARNV
ncbi:M15 family metallopeptidase [Flavobacterium sp. SE-s28]|uniref:M15 family metallopeptidase n=1 Tax=Flavobacterium silvaticum TaxID=1852020 RepID=A0A972FLM3_9FLAO|nr:M15 family metallopeptidase [Flavobacterium silvaticum]